MYGSLEQCFFNLFFEVEPFAAILIAPGAHGYSQEFVMGGGTRAFLQRVSIACYAMRCISYRKFCPTV